jgi:hypothetical protein
MIVIRDAHAEDRAPLILTARMVMLGLGLQAGAPA